MVHPNFRRRGIFTKLLTECITDLKTRNVNTILLNAPTDSQSAREFLRSIPCSFSMSEYQMKWQKTELFLDTSVSLRPSVSLEDFEAEVQLDILAFGLEEHEAREYNKQVKEFNTEQQYIIETSGKTAGKMRVAEDNGEAWIYGFAIFPELQGKGIGKMALSKLVTMESHKGLDIFLEVEAKNAHALRLYQSCGFRSYHSQDYYEYQN
jgi:ribosomal protein S18 acetylase RimI-like enzyme